MRIELYADHGLVSCGITSINISMGKGEIVKVLTYWEDKSNLEANVGQLYFHLVTFG
jgi:hypothetical protein